jgi:alkylation response protein AidB-like acyl-CoA dehydrogenase
MTAVRFTEEHAALAATVREFCAKKSPEGVVRGLIERGEGADRAMWEQMAAQIGMQGLIIPESYGGLGAGLLELVLVLEELGAALACPSFLSTAIAAATLLVAADEGTQATWLPGIADGTTFATVALNPDPDTRQPVDARPVADEWVLDGATEAVADGIGANLIIVAANTAGGPAFFAVEGQAAGLERTVVRSTDVTRPVARLTFAGTPAAALGGEGAGELLRLVVDQAALLVSAEQIGGARRCAAMAADYAQTRHQFGRAIGDFQAIQHKCVDMLLAVEPARAAVYHAAALAAAGASAEFALAAPLAKAACAEASLAVAAANIQVHGGIGFTWEHPAHLYFRRALANGTYMGGARLHRELLVRRLGLEETERTWS